MGSDSVATGSKKASPWLWFLGTGIGEMIVALIAAYGIHAPLPVLFVLLPTLMLLGVDPSPSSPMKELIQGLILFGGTFLLYGTVGWLIGSAIQDWHPSADTTNK
jgi:hypothetical protein